MQDPARNPVYLIHLGWVVFLILTIIHFWWFQFRLSGLTEWTFEIYFFVVFYATLLYSICAVLIPEHVDEYFDYRAYFHSRQKWFYGLLACVFAVDIIDTALKGSEHFHALGIVYPIRQAVLFALSIAAIFVKSWRYHAIFLVVGLLAQIFWIFSQFYRQL